MDYTTIAAQTVARAAKRMQAVYATQLRPDAAIWTSGTGSPNGVVAAPVGSL
ncbi:hypothetical protein [Sphingomonas sp. Mn802worker]|uniref:hypothetical protein n=1 Tax=Sphingomonas sp. Mn802worker TaxID=629773 RepID=UPI0003A6875C|nr:hypothetical protein [Sphingomonas sp. Mn802worker]